MKRLIYAALFSMAFAASISPGQAIASSGLLTTSGLPPAWRSNTTPREPSPIDSSKVKSVTQPMTVQGNNNIQQKTNLPFTLPVTTGVQTHR